MNFLMVIESENAAFSDDGPAEVARLLREVADKVEAGGDYGRLMDYNGNGCGEWELDDE